MQVSRTVTKTRRILNVFGGTKAKTMKSKRKPYENDLSSKALKLSLFYWDKKNNVLTAEDSDLRGNNHPFWYFGALYNDVADTGIAIRSETTGVVERFSLTKKNVSEGDILSFEFSPVNKSCKIRSVIIYND